MTDIDAELVELEYGPDYDGRDDPCPNCSLGNVVLTGPPGDLESAACDAGCGFVHEGRAS